MSKLLCSIYNDYMIIDNVTLIKEFSEKLFRINIDDIPYEILGENLILHEVTNDNKTIKITGTFISIKVENNKPKQNSSFIKRLFS